MKLTLFSIDEELCNEWKKCFELDPVAIKNCDVSKLESSDILVTAGNSYGIMNGGLDLAIRDFFGIALQDSIQWAIAEFYRGTLPVGSVLTVDTNSRKFPTLFYVSTMAIPSVVPVQHVSICFYNTLSALKNYESASIACCGFGAGTGGIPADVVAKEMKRIYDLLK